MKTSVNTIRFVTILSVSFLILTYAISLNDENRWLLFNTPWLSHNFLFTVAGGSFASLVVIFACEIQKYFVIKRQTEDSSFSQLFSLYTQITIIHYNTKRQLNEQNTPVPSNLIDEMAYRGQMFLERITNIDYFTFKNHNLIRDELNQYKGENGMKIRSFLQCSVFLKLAINEDKISMLQIGKDEIVTSKSQKTHDVLKKIYDDSAALLLLIEKSLETIDKECKNRYHWNEIKQSVILAEEEYTSIA